MTTSRRRARGEHAKPDAFKIPAPLRSLDDPFWDDARAVGRMLADLGDRTPVPDERASRMLRTVDAWAKVNGLMSERWPQMVDQRRLRALGVYRPTARDRIKVADA